MKRNRLVNCQSSFYIDFDFDFFVIVTRRVSILDLDFMLDEMTLVLSRIPNRWTRLLLNRRKALLSAYLLNTWF